jgi:EspA/EspE family
VSALDGFRSIWTNANAAFGQGTPSGGAQFDQSGSLHQLQNTVNSARPEANWMGAASDSYSDANTRQARTLGGIADLDKRLAVEVDRAAAVVTAGRRDLDSIRRLVNDAAATVPNNVAGERMLYPTISKGSKDIQEILTRSHGDLTAIGERIRGIGSDYQLLGDGDGGTGGTNHDKPPKPRVPDTALDLNDIVQLPVRDDKGNRILGPRGYKELVPNSGTWVPDPSSPDYRPTPVEAPLDLNRIVQLGVYDDKGKRILGPTGFMELVPNSGTWVPNPKSTPPGTAYPSPEAPLDLNDIHVYGTVDGNGKRIFGLPWEMELIPHTGVWVPNPAYGRPR